MISTYKIIPATVICLLFYLSQVSGAVRKCLENSDCYSNECCAQAFYLFRCEQIGNNNGDSCGLCGCGNGLTCISEGYLHRQINPFKILASRGVCRYRPGTNPESPQPRPIKPQLPETLVPPSGSKIIKPDKIKPTKDCPESVVGVGVDKPVRPGKDRFHEIFQPIYEQFLELAVSVAGINIDDLERETTQNSVRS